MKHLTKNSFERILSGINTKHPISYGKSRVAGSNQTTYYMHSKSACMPGQPTKFKENLYSGLKPNLISLENTFTRLYKRENYLIEQKPIGKKYITDNIEAFTYQVYTPYDDSSLKIAITACYKQVYGNLYPMDSEKSIDSERRLRNGDICIRDFVRDLAKSSFYKYHYFTKVSQIKCLEMNFKHLLGRPIVDQNELINNIELINSYGFDNHIDSIIDSIEYQELFGEDVVPYERFWDSPIGARTSSFIKTAAYQKGFATSDNLNC
ncbi:MULTISPECIES: phycobilisome rod-core linker polypeptide [Prochlorococcus]|uniref:phycobilisome rod-core linker polypeptide n=1 Tax=Prochlorococcus TaxID=1218 RepID=UPI0005338C0E|nr:MULTISPECIES: phycobilisome rod-core linker polypeptide [Prochlorococcus]KGG13050.1 Phycoerythrin gamma chain linker polypeptide [Prochlorococcus sp. MIT 0601]